MRVWAGMDVSAMIESFFLSSSTLFLSYMVIALFRQDRTDVGCGLANRKEHIPGMPFYSSRAFVPILVE